MTESIIKVKNLTKSFGKLNAVDGVTFEVEQKEIFGFLGPNGCVDNQTEILTREGWKSFADATLDDEILTMNPETRRLDYTKPVDKIDVPYEGDMVCFDGKDVNFKVTPGHNMFVSKRRGATARTPFRFHHAKEIVNGWHFVRGGVWKGLEKKEFVLPKAASVNHSYPDLSIPMDMWLEFLGWYLAEGSTDGDGDAGKYRVIISQKNKKERLGRFLSAFVFYASPASHRQVGMKNYTMNDKRLYLYLRQFGNAPQKFVPDYVKDLSPRQIDIFLDAYRLGDGNIHKGQLVYSTSSKRMAGDLQELILKAGRAAIVTMRHSDVREIRTQMVDGTIEAHMLPPGDRYVVSEQRMLEPGFSSKKKRVAVMPYRGRVYCFTLPKYHLLHVRREGKTLWIGNSGKTTTIRMLTTLLRPTSGSATVNGYDIVGHPDDVRASTGSVQQEYTADEDLSGKDNIMFVAALHGIPMNVSKLRTRELLDLVGLADAADRKVMTYSGGMRRRLEIAAGLVNHPRVLFLDEPTLGLDTQTRTAVWDYIKKLKKDYGMTLFMTTHYLEEADGLCDRIAIIDHGKIIKIGSPADLKAGLGGDVIEIGVKGASDDLTQTIAAVSGVKEVRKTDGNYRIKAERGDETVAEIVNALRSRGICLSKILVTKPTLDQVYLEYTGKTIREEEASRMEIMQHRMTMQRARS